MKIVLVCFAAIVFFATPGMASDYFSPLRTQDMVLQGAWLGLHVVDFMQTHDIVRNPDKFHEQNPILGKHPSTGNVNTFFLASAVIHTGIVWALPQKQRVWFQGIGIVIKAGTVASNKHLGLGLYWPF